jgi:pyruvyl transferase EpsO
MSPASGLASAGAPAASAPRRVRSAALVTELADLAAHALRPLVATDAPCAVIDFPNHTNVGDSAIWLGQSSLLQRLGVRAPRYTCDYGNYSPERLAARVGGGTILLTGGGNFGDLYPHHQELREAVIAAFPGNPIVQLPQSIHFVDRRALEACARLCDAHPNFTLMVRDHASRELAERTFRSRVVLCPDMAFGLGPLARLGTVDHDIVHLARRDREAKCPGEPVVRPGVLRVDWLGEREVLLHRMHGGLRRRSDRHAALAPLWPLATLLYDPLARHRLRRGVTLLSRGRRVVTDRLHAHILSLLLGIPHCVLDNSYGKVRGCWEAWTHVAASAAWCDSEAEAFAKVGELDG